MLRIFGFGMLKMLGVGVRNFTMFRALRLGGQTFSSAEITWLFHI